MASFDLSVTGAAMQIPTKAQPTRARTPPDPVIDLSRVALNETIDLSCVALNETQSWCYHEGSHGHNPEYGNTHTLTRTRNKSFNGSHTKVDYEDNLCGVEKTTVAGVETFWKIHTAGESNVPKEVSATGQIGHSHKISLDGDTLTVIVHYQETQKKKTTILSVTKLYHAFVRTKKVVQFSV
jgi:hypothetical protein